MKCKCGTRKYPVVVAGKVASYLCPKCDKVTVESLTK